jgi:hypothetical protein
VRFPGRFRHVFAILSLDILPQGASAVSARASDYTEGAPANQLDDSIGDTLASSPRGIK